MLVIRRVIIRDMIWVVVTFMCLCVLRNLITNDTSTSPFILTPPSPPDTSLPLVIEEGYAVELSDVRPKEVRSWFLPLVTSFFGVRGYNLAPPPTSWPLLKYSLLLSHHLQAQATGRARQGRNIDTATDTSYYQSASSSTLSTPASPSSFSSSVTSPYDSPSSVSSSSTLSSIRGSPSSSPFSTRGLVKELVALVEKVELPCAKILRQGGRTCKRIPDGDKKVCTDPAVAPTWTSCLVYSFGLGHDFTFDAAMAKLGCEVFVFDDDDYHDVYPSHPFLRTHFGHVRLGSKVLRKFVDDKVRNSTYEYLYRPLDNIMYILGHASARLDLLKVDIEGDEWEVFEESLFKTDILERTGQLAIEVHMSDFLKANITSEETLTALHKYISFFNGLRARGFRLAHYEPNYLSPAFATVRGITFPVMVEQLWVNTRPRPRPRTRPRTRPSHALHTSNPHAQAIRRIELLGETS